MVLCILVEQKVIENPLDLISGKKPESSQTVETDTAKAKLTDYTLINSVDALFVTVRDDEDDNYYIYDRTYQKIGGTDYIFYDVAEPADEDEELDETTADTCEDGETDCTTETKTIDEDNYEDYPHYRYSFAKSASGDYEFREKYLIETPSVK